MLKKYFIVLILLFFGSFAIAGCAITGGACKIDDIISTQNKKEVNAPKKSNLMKFNSTKSAQKQIEKPQVKNINVTTQIKKR